MYSIKLKILKNINFIASFVRTHSCIGPSIIIVRPYTGGGLV